MELFAQTKKLILDTLFPIACLHCGAPDTWLCEKCLAQIKLLTFQVCPACEQTITEAGYLCGACKNLQRTKNHPFYLDALLVAAKYKTSGLNRLVHLYKYRFIADLSAPLGTLLTQTLLKNNLPMPDVIIPVPLHTRRLRWRGFNQSALLANHLAQNLMPNLPIPILADVLARQKYTPPQMTLQKYAERQENLKDAFAIKEASQIQGKTILLVDDVATTGTTLLECTKVLKLAGAKKVFGVVIARQEIE